MKKFFRVSFGQGLFIDMPNDQDIPLTQFVANVLMVGYIMTDAYYVPVSSINYIATAQFEPGAQITPFKPTLVS